MANSHPILNKMLGLGCKTRKNVLLSFQTYMELCEVHLFRDAIEFYLCKNTDIIYLIASAQSQRPEIYVSISVHDSISPSWLNSIHTNICEKHNALSFILVIRESDTTSAAYRITDGLLCPLSPESTRKRKHEEEKKKIFAKDLLERLPSLYETALSKKESEIMNID